MSLPTGIAIVFGARIGTSITSIFAAIGTSQDAKRVASVHVLFNTLGALVPKLRVNLARFHDIFAPNSKHRRINKVEYPD
jgi:Na+/phosphate symporter